MQVDDMYEPPQYMPPLPIEEGQRHYSEIYSHDGSVTEKDESWTHPRSCCCCSWFRSTQAWEVHAEAHGQEPSHEQMKETIAAIAAAEVDKLVETKHLIWIDKERAQHDAVVQAQHYAQLRYGEQGNGWQQAQQHRQPQPYPWPGQYGSAPYEPAYGLWNAGWGRYGGWGDGYGPLMGYGPVYRGPYAGPVGAVIFGVFGVVGSAWDKHKAKVEAKKANGPPPPGK